MTQTSTSIKAHNVTYESIFQADIVAQMRAQGWQLGNPSGRLRYMRKTC